MNATKFVMYRRSTRIEHNKRLYLYWDIENVPPSHDPHADTQDVRDILSSRNLTTKGVDVHLRVYFSADQQPDRETLRTLEKAGFDIRCTYIRKKEAADRLIVKDMSRDIDLGTAQDATFVVLSRDHDFYPNIRRLHRLGANTLIIRPKLIENEQIPPDIAEVLHIWKRRDQSGLGEHKGEEHSDREVAKELERQLQEKSAEIQKLKEQHHRYMLRKKAEYQQNIGNLLPNFDVSESGRWFCVHCTYKCTSQNPVQSCLQHFADKHA